MNCLPDRTNAPGISAESVPSENPAHDGFTGVRPVTAEDAGWVGIVGKAIYRLNETIPTA